MQSSPHQQRILTGLLLTAVLLACLFLGGWWIFLALALFSGWGMLEFYRLFWPGSQRLWLKVLGLVLALAMLLAAKASAPALALAAILASFWLTLLAFLFDPGSQNDTQSLSSYFILPAGLLYVPAMLQFVLHFQRLEILLVLLAAFLSDTGAFYAGSRFGKRKLWPRVSPKKTWEGSLGGMLACTSVTILLVLIFGSASLLAAAALGIVLNIAAQFGDLMESAAKRSMGVKDSGKLLPGHGGLLDRIDGLLFVVPVYAAARFVVPFF